MSYNDKYYHDFKRRKKQFQPYEIKASSKVLQHFGEGEVVFNDDYKYDFIHKGLTFEIKCDTNRESKNFYIAYYDLINDRPSQISKSESNYYIITDTVNYYMIETAILLSMVESSTYRSVPNKDKSALGYLVPKIDIINQSKIL
jgi:hypothetical protein